MNEGFSRRVAWIAGLGLLALAWLLAYALPRMRDLDRLDQATARFDRDRGAIAEALAGYAGLRRDLPAPAPSTSAFMFPPF